MRLGIFAAVDPPRDAAEAVCPGFGDLVLSGRPVETVPVPEEVLTTAAAAAAQ